MSHVTLTIMWLVMTPQLDCWGLKGESSILCEAYLCFFCGLLCVCSGVWNIGDLDF